MKKILFSLLVVVFFAMNAYAQVPSPKDLSIKLPEPQKDGGGSLMKALAERRTIRHFSNYAMDKQMLSNLLWAAFGITSADGKRTIPTAKNTQNLRIYVLLESGSYIYSARTNSLVFVAKGDLRGKSGAYPDELKYASAVLVFVEAKRDKYNMYNTGASTQNVSLFCAAHGLNSWIIGSFYDDNLRDALKINENEDIQLIQAVGKPISLETVTEH